MSRVKVTVKYEMGHSYNFTYHNDKSYCPCCGEMEVWAKDGYGDCYCGPNHVCLACNVSFTIQGPRDASKEEQQVIDQILDTL